MDWIEDSKITIDERTQAVERLYKLKFKGYPEAEWQPEDRVDALALIRCYWENVYSKGREGCIEAQKEFLQTEPVSDSEDEPIETRKSGATHKRLKPRPRARSDSRNEDMAESSDSSSDESDSDNRPLELNALTGCTRYEPSDPERRRSMKAMIDNIKVLETDFRALFSSANPKFHQSDLPTPKPTHPKIRLKASRGPSSRPPSFHSPSSQQTATTQGQELSTPPVVEEEDDDDDEDAILRANSRLKRKFVNVENSESFLFSQTKKTCLRVKQVRIQIDNPQRPLDGFH